MLKFELGTTDKYQVALQLLKDAQEGRHVILTSYEVLQQLLLILRQKDLSAEFTRQDKGRIITYDVGLLDASLLYNFNVLHHEEIPDYSEEFL